MTKEEIARLRALCEAATPGPWKQSWAWTGKHTMPMCIEAGKELVIGTLDEYEDQRPSDAEFIAAARTALPAALDEIERLRNVIRAAATDLDVSLDDGDISNVREALYAAIRPDAGRK